MNETALELPRREAKPRRAGVTMVVDGGLPLRSLRDLVDSAGEYVDLVKFGWGTAVVSGEIGKKVALLQEHGIDYYLGGTLFEKHVLQDRFDAFRWLCHDLSCRYVEVSNGTVDLPNAEKAGYIRTLADEMCVISEVGFKDVDRSEQLSATQWAEYVEEDLDAGARLVTLEARESGSSGICRPDGQLRVELVEDLVTLLPVERLLFEAPTSSQQAYFVRRIGPDVNIGNVAASGVLSLETLRLGLRADTLLALEPDPAQLQGVGW